MLARVRPNRLALPLAVLLCLVLAAPAGAAFDWRTQVMDFEFQPAERKISVGDTVTWEFTNEGHTSASVGGQPDSWKSAETGTNPAGTTYTHQFNTPGRFQYVCLQHRDFMKGSVEVGTDTVIDSIDNFKTKRKRHTAKISFLLNEAATVTYRLKGPSKRTVKKGRLAAGRHAFTLRRLKKGTYRGVLTVVDDFDKKITPRNFFVIR
jgi:plastocyanin